MGQREDEYGREREREGERGEKGMEGVRVG